MDQVTDLTSTTAAPAPELLGDADDSIFAVPAEVEDDERLSRLYNEIVDKLKAEVQGIPLSTMQYLLIERTASLYVTIKHHEENGTFLPRQQQQYNAQFLAAGAEFNKLVQNNQEAQRQLTVDKIRSAIVAAINRLSDPDARMAMKTAIADEFQKAGL
jgi:hypothetical protein